MYLTPTKLLPLAVVEGVISACPLRLSWSSVNRPVPSELSVWLWQLIHHSGYVSCLVYSIAAINLATFVVATEALYDRSSSVKGRKG